MPLTIRHVHPTLRQHGWRRLLRQWGALMDEWCDQYRKDAPYCYGERPLTGLLAAAAWKLGNGMSLEEVEAQRMPGRRIAFGRLDAWIVLRGVFYHIEAKGPVVFGSNSGTLKVAIRRVCEELKEAARDVRNVPDLYQGDRGVALCYLLHVPRWPQGKKKPPGDELLEAVASHFGSGAYAVSAWYTPPAGQRPEDWSKEGGKRVRWWYPGVALVGQIVRLKR